MKAPIVTDLSVPLTKLTALDIKLLIARTKDDPWAVPIHHDVSELFEKLQYGYSNPERMTVRQLAVHVANRHAYYRARTAATCIDHHQLLDDLLGYTGPMEGSMPPYVFDKDSRHHETIGRFNFLPYIEHYPELKSRWERYSYKLQSN